METNGRKNPPRPRIEVAHPSASPQEAAAIAAAIEQFLRDTQPAPLEPEKNAWQRRALAEGVHLQPGAETAWGDSQPWGR